LGKKKGEAGGLFLLIAAIRGVQRTQPFAFKPTEMSHSGRGLNRWKKTRQSRCCSFGRA